MPSFFQHTLKAISLAGLLFPVIGLAQTQPAPATGRVIVSFKPTAGIVAQNATQLKSRVASLEKRTGFALQALTSPAPNLQVVTAQGVSSETLAKRLAQEADVAYAEPDRLRKPSLSVRPVVTPSDPYFASKQWYLQSTEVSAMRLPEAWGITTGNNVTVAFLDTGVRFDHEDLAGQLLPGYDFVSNTVISNDGDGWDSDASDPGDWVSSDEAKIEPFAGAGCGQADSSWHGTHVAGIIGALSNNGTGIAGVSWKTRLLPVRVLGKCSGYDSDIIAGMRWAAGLSVNNVPTNPNPAKILNLSLGGPGVCGNAYQDTVNALTAKGVLVFVAAGNENAEVDAPANCSGVIAVAAVRNDGTKAGYSNLGSEVAISAPGGNCGSSSSGCEFPIIATSNQGTTVPTQNGYDVGLGTSYSTPLAAGVAALMLSVNGELSPADLLNHLQASATAFPARSDLKVCDVVSNNLSCNCTSNTCGAGMINAASALILAPAPVVSFSSGSADTKAGSLALDGSGTKVFGGRSITQWTWSVSNAPNGTSFEPSNAAKTTLTVPSGGSYTVTLSVTDSDGNTNQKSEVVNVQKENSKDDGGGGSADALLLVSVLLLGWHTASRTRNHAKD